MNDWFLPEDERPWTAGNLVVPHVHGATRDTIRFGRCIAERETNAWTAPDRPNPKMSGHSVSQNMKKAIRRLSPMALRTCITASAAPG